MNTLAILKWTKSLSDDELLRMYSSEDYITPLEHALVECEAERRNLITVVDVEA